MINELSRERLADLISYDGKTGIFTWKLTRGRAKKGAAAGHLQVDGYMTIRVDNRKYYAHRLAWLYVYGRWPNQNIDHINGIRDDNRVSNLRDVPQSVNNKNLHRAQSNNKHGVLGVTWVAHRKKWTARIRIDGKQYWLGSFDCKYEAQEARLKAGRISAGL